MSNQYVSHKMDGSEELNSRSQIVPHGPPQTAALSQAPPSSPSLNTGSRNSRLGTFAPLPQLRNTRSSGSLIAPPSSGLNADNHFGTFGQLPVPRNNSFTGSLVPPPSPKMNIVGQFDFFGPPPLHRSNSLSQFRNADLDDIEPHSNIDIWSRPVDPTETSKKKRGREDTQTNSHRDPPSRARASRLFGLFGAGNTQEEDEITLRFGTLPTSNPATKGPSVEERRETERKRAAADKARSEITETGLSAFGKWHFQTRVMCYKMQNINYFVRAPPYI